MPSPRATSVHGYAGPSARRGSLLATAVALVRIWIARSRERRQLATMTMREMRDIGITRYDALTEAGKPFWRR